MALAVLTTFPPSYEYVRLRVRWNRWITGGLNIDKVLSGS